MTDPLNVIFDEFGIMMSRLYDRVQLYIHIFHKGIIFVAMWSTDEYING